MATSDGPTRLLVSICNVAVAPRPSCLLQLEFETGNATWIDVGASEPLVTGTGICFDDHFVYHVSVTQQDFRTLLHVLDRRTLDVVEVAELAGVFDPHSIRRMGDELFVASTGTDQVFAFSMKGPQVAAERRQWTPTGSGDDTHHINSLEVHEGRLLCSAFGPREGDRWSTARGGYIFDITRGEHLVTGLRQPHSVAVERGEIYFCNSQEGTVNGVAGPIADLASYSRGLTFAPDGAWYAGTSVSRHRGAEHGDDAVFDNPDAPGQLLGRCAIVRMTSEGEMSEVDITKSCAEIYDVALLDGLDQ